MIDVLLVLLAVIAVAALIGGITLHNALWLFVVLLVALAVAAALYPRRRRRP